MRKVKHSLKREDVVEQLKDLTQTATSKNWAEEKNQQLVKLLTKQKIAVLPPDLNMMVGRYPTSPTAQKPVLQLLQ